MAYPQLRKSLFDFDRSYTVPSNYVGKLELIANDIYGYPYFYKPLAVANSIILPHGYRIGVRNLETSIYNELYSDGYRGNDLLSELNKVYNSLRQNSYDIYSHTDVSYGMVSGCYEGRVLQVPTFETANNWLFKYQFPSNSE
jgi:hypothetical protein